MDKQIVVDSYNGILHGNKKYKLRDMKHYMDEFPEHYTEWKKPYTK